MWFLTSWLPVNGCVVVAAEHIVDQKVGVLLTALLLLDRHILAVNAPKWGNNNRHLKMPWDVMGMSGISKRGKIEFGSFYP